MEQENFDQEKNNDEQQNPLLIPFAIIIAGVIIAAAVIFSFTIKKPATVGNSPSQQQASAQTAVSGPSISDIVPVSPEDHIRGNPNAEIKVVEFSDLECPFCKRFQPVMEQLLSAYGDKMAWVYRHDPIAQLHPKAFHEAVASECAAEQGGNDTFWKYIDGVFQVTPSNNQLDPAQLDVIAKNLGLDMQKFDSCLSSNRYDQKIQSQMSDALKTGPQSTPYSVVIINGRPVASIDGAYDFAGAKQIIDSALSQSN